MKFRSGKKLICAAAVLILLLAALACVLRISVLAGRLEAQKEAERWQGEDELDFAQVSVFLKETDKVTLSEINSFRYAMEKAFKDASVDIEGTKRLFTDAYSVNDTLTVSTEYGSSEAAVTAVGGSFFDFHPLTLESGGYFGDSEPMQDRVLIDRELSWALYGGTELTGMEVIINGEHFVISGVYDHEEDKITKNAYSGGAAFYMSFEAYCRLTGKDGISCYEVVLPDPVKNFAEGVVKEQFPLHGGEYVVNTGRFGVKNLLSVYKNRYERTMKASPVSYPYWENAARVTEGKCAGLLAAAGAALAPTVILTLAAALVYAVRGKRALEERIIPELSDRIGERIRARQRKRREKKNSSARLL